MKPILLLTSLFVALLFTSCQKRMSCPAYNNIDSGRTAGDPTRANDMGDDKTNKADIEKQREAELSGRGQKKSSKSYSLFPKWMGVKSH